MRLRVRLFGGLADLAGAGEVALDVPAGSTPATVRARFAADRPDLAPLLERVSVAVNLEVVGDDHPLAEDDEVALLPPVAGGAPTVLVSVRPPPLPLDEALTAIGSPAAGATVVFVGTVRDHSPALGRVERLEYRAYEAMAERVLQDVADEVADRWPAVTGVALLHAVGDLPVTAHTVLVACSAPHRDDAFDACRYALEELKQRAPVWKREVGPDGARWVGLDEHDGH